jgi:hypothetical protein
LGITVANLGQKRHTPLSPATADLTAEARHIASMLMAHEHLRLVHEGVAGAHDPEKRIEVASTRKKGTAIEGLVETT